jgi:hypothetical protein
MTQKIHAPTKTYPYYLNQFRLDNSNVSFPQDISEELFAEYGVYSVVETEKPTYNPLTENLVELTPVKIENQWVQTWQVTDATDEEIVLRKEQQKVMLEAKRAEAYRNESDPLFFKSQRGEVSVQVWLDKVAEIKSRYPD